MFPERLELLLRGFDDAIIRFIQSILQYESLSGAARVVALACSAITTIEVGFSVPVFLLLCKCYDCLAVYATYVMISMAFITQLPKRFIWRTRPFAAGRAKRVRVHDSSSFPSRAVVGAVVYSLWLLTMFEDKDWSHGSESNDNGKCTSPSWFPKTIMGGVLVLFAALATSASRVVLGVHYPSDCIGGAILGFVIHLAGTGLTRLHLNSCDCCGKSSHSNILGSTFTLTVGLIVAVMVFYLLILPPLEYWKKISHAGSLLFPCLIFVIAFLCPSFTGASSLNTAPHLTLDNAVTAVFVTIVLTALGLASQRKKLQGSIPIQIGVFTGLLVLVGCSICLARVWTD